MKKRLLIALVVLLALAGTASLAWGQGTTVCHVPDGYETIQEAVDDHACEKIIVGPGDWYGAIVARAVEIRGEEGAVINDGPPYSADKNFGFKLYDGVDRGSGSRITGFEFTSEVDFPIFANLVDDVTVDHNIMHDSLQGVTVWAGSGWDVRHNEIVDLRTDNGGGIGIIFAHYQGGPINDNVAAHNKITGTLHVDPDDGGGYNGTGIVLYADFRWGATGASEIAHNRIVRNTISLTSDTPGVVDVVAIELTESYYPLPHPGDDPVIEDNAIGFNDLRGTVLQLALTPADLDEVNDISRNLGDNRGQGLHPSVFGPGG